MRNAYNQVLIQYPEVWLTRFHYLVPVSALLLGTVIWFGRYLPPSIDPTTFFYLSFPLLVIVCFTGFFWVRFQFLRCQQAYVPQSILRLFFLNTAGCFLFLAIPSLPYVETRFRIAQLHKTNDLNGDLSLMKLSAYYADSIFCDQLEKTEIHGPPSASIRHSRLKPDNLHLPGWGLGRKWPGLEKVGPAAERIATRYGLDKFHGESYPASPNDYLAYLDTIALRWNAVPDTLTLLFRYSMTLICTATMISLLILHLITGQGLRLLASGSLSVTGCILIGIALVDPWLPHGMFLNVSISFVLLLIFLVVTFNWRKDEVRSNEKTFAILALPYTLFVFWIMGLDMTYYATMPSQPGRHGWTWFWAMVGAYGTGLLFLVYYILWYWRYSFRPQK